EAVFTKNAPVPLPQFSQAIRHQGKVYVSGNIGTVPGTQNQLVDGTVKNRATQAIRNIKAVLEAAGTTLEHVIKMNIYITKMANFSLVNEAYDQFFTWDLKPARTCIAVHGLPHETDVEIECIAYIP
ncbi:Endoribonuclease L-PSP/chorismate mutase-like protein, partial [Plectosphaerella plurivora]